MSNYVDSNNSKSLTLILYILYIVAIFSAGILAIIAFIPFLFLFFTMDNANAFAGIALSATIFCGLTLFISWIWIVYRAIRGIIALNDDQALPL
ncbi:MAG: hypothetical protein GAK29_02057 [Acinetobacter bereziniae]|uniref:DUF485 domain-containing protein n=1 Tax=Acinetobacter bereziniae TaxID=106648 RepID=A0A833TY24_ACIBZ|nr:MAG: hypothetical protein GAK29_02057 [Acinetobacter bereziniae]